MTSIKKAVEDLKAELIPAKDITEVFRKMYLAIIEMDFVTDGSAHSGKPWAEYRAWWEAEHNMTEEKSIEAQMTRWKRLHNLK